MEAVPRLPMLHFELRTSVDKVDFSYKLKQYIRSYYNEDPTLYGAGMTGIDTLRREAVNPSKSIAGCSLMKRYYCQLHLMASRFPMRENEEAAVAFSWKCPHTASTVSLNDISLEMASILYNIGALHTQLGAMDSRTSAEGMKMSCTHFQCAAWAFQHINEKFPFSKSLGLSPMLTSFMCHLSLAQAQECILEKSMMDNRKSAITAKVGIQVVEYYRQSLNLLNEWPQNEDVTSLKVLKNWSKYLQFKIAYYESLSLLFQGQQSEDQQKMGERVTYYQAAHDKLEEARKLPPGIENVENIAEALTFVHDVIEAKRKAAKNENEFIYHEDVPSLSHLPKIKGASLVKGIPFSIDDPEVCGPDLFSNIVPMQAHESASLYSEEKAKLLRRINGMIENKDEELETFLSMLDLDELKSKVDGSKLPQDLIDRCASLSAKPDAIRQLTEAMAKLADVYQDVGSMLTEIQEMLEKEDHHEKEYQQTFGGRPPSIVATDLTREAKKYQEAHAKASESNQTLHKAMVMHISNLKLLSLPLKELMTQIPAISESSEVEAIINEIQHLVVKVDEMKKQRFMLASQLRDLVRQDDITRLVMTYSGDKMEDLFEKELKKYDKHVSLIEQNLAAQENILRAMKEAYARYGSSRKSTGESHRRRGLVISSLVASYDAYEDLLSKSSKGLDFYKKLETNVSKLLQRVRSTCKVQDEEREQLLKSVRKVEQSLQPSVASSDVPAATSLKLKDYLNIKKETGKLSLSQPPEVAPASPMLPQSWTPDARPAPLGSEETDVHYGGAPDTFHGFYQSQGKDQVWTSSEYSAPQNADQKLKYFGAESANSFNGISQNAHFSDAYPISSYSTALSKAKGKGGYEPKSNYYDIDGSPNRCYNPVQSYGETVTGASVPLVTDTNYAVTEAGHAPSQECSNAHRHNVPDLSAYYGYSSAVNANFSHPQQAYSTFGARTEATVGTYVSVQPYESQPTPPTPPSAYLTHGFPPATLPFASIDPVQIPYSSGAPSSSQMQTSSGYSYAPILSDQMGNLSASSYATPGQSAIPAVPPSVRTGSYVQEQMSGYKSYQPSTEAFASDNQNSARAPASQPSYPYEMSYAPNQALSSPYGQCSGSYALPSQNCQYLQSGNESLYTASGSSNEYAITSSDVYKSSEHDDATRQRQYGNQYYNNRYGAYNGQAAEMGSQSGYSATYMQAGTDKQQAVTTTTFSSSEAKSSPVSNPSNVDLLAGLDFNISQSPLVPEVSQAKKEASTEEVAETKVSQKSSLEAAASENNDKSNATTDGQLNSNAGEKKTFYRKEMTTNVEYVSRLAQELDKLQKFVESLTSKTLSGPTNLDVKWKEIVEAQEKINPQHIISVARCYPMKNRCPDILPYDDSRVELPSTKDDYINASRMTGLTDLSPPYILTQAPLPSTYADFWVMVFEQQVEVIICLVSDAEINGHSYWPSEKGQELVMGRLKVSLQSCNVRSHWVERIFSVSPADSRATRVVVHLQLTSWPGSSFPESPVPFLSFASECKSFIGQQRSYNHPVVVHCLSGVGRTGLFCLVIASILDIEDGNGIPDLARLASRMSQFRKSCLRDREHLKFAYQSVLHYGRDYLSKVCGWSGIGGDANGEQLESKMERLQMDSPSDIEKEKERASVGETCMKESNVESSSQAPKAVGIRAFAELDAGTFTLKSVSSNPANRKLTSESNPTESDDPLSQLDPLWTMKK